MNTKEDIRTGFLFVAVCFIAALVGITCLAVGAWNL